MRLVDARKRGAECNKLRGRYDRAHKAFQVCESFDDIECVHKTRRARNLARNLAKKKGCKWISRRGLGSAGRRRRSPINFSCRDAMPPDWRERLDDDEGIECKVTCIRGVRAIKIRDTRNSRNTAVIHPSTKYGKGSWQASIFDSKRGPMYDLPATSCSDAIQQVLDTEGAQWGGRITPTGLKPNFVIEEWA